MESSDRLLAALILTIFVGLARAEVPESYARLWNDPVVADRIERGIDTHRKDVVEIAVTGNDGGPIAGATVEIRQQTHDFLFGCNLFVLDQLETPELNRKYEAAFTNLFSFAALPFYWRDLEPQRGQFSRLPRRVHGHCAIRREDREAGLPFAEGARRTNGSSGSDDMRPAMIN